MIIFVEFKRETWISDSVDFIRSSGPHHVTLRFGLLRQFGMGKGNPERVRASRNMLGQVGKG